MKSNSYREKDSEMDGHKVTPKTPNTPPTRPTYQQQQSPDIVHLTGSSSRRRTPRYVDSSTSESESEEEDDEPLNREFEWTDHSMTVFYRLLLRRGFRPVGINKHIKMLGAHAEFCRLMQQHVSIQCLWDHFDELYNLEALERLEPLTETPIKDFNILDHPELRVLATKRMEEDEEELLDIPESELPIVSPEPYKYTPAPPLKKGRFSSI